MWTCVLGCRRKDYPSSLSRNPNPQQHDYKWCVRHSDIFMLRFLLFSVWLQFFYHEALQMPHFLTWVCLCKCFMLHFLSDLNGGYRDCWFWRTKSWRFSSNFFFQLPRKRSQLGTLFRSKMVAGAGGAESAHLNQQNVPDTASTSFLSPAFFFLLLFLLLFLCLSVCPSIPCTSCYVKENTDVSVSSL